MNEEYPQEQQPTQEPKEKKTGKKFYVICSIVMAVVCFFGGALSVWLSLDKEMRSLIAFKRRMQNSYYQTVTDEEFYGALFGAVNSQILDSYSAYLTPEEYEQSRLRGKGNQSGLGVSLSIKNALTNEDQLKIAYVCGNSPAEAAGLKTGEYIVGFGKTKDLITDSQSYEQFSVFLSGVQTGMDVSLKIRNTDGERIVTLQKKSYVENYVFYRTKTQSYRFTGNKALQLTQAGEPLPSLNDNTAYIRLSGFNGNATEQFDQAMQLFKRQNKRHLILDLRQNGGGYLNILEEIASYFCKNTQKKRPTVAIAQYTNKSEVFIARENVYNEYFSADSRICVLADEGTASASEALMGCMLDYGTITYQDICLTANASGIAKTYGKGIMQTTFPLRLLYGDAAKLTTARMVWPTSKTCIHDRGIVLADGSCSVQQQNVEEMEIALAIQALNM